eukprot:27822-Rhodomonas_salina.2
MDRPWNSGRTSVRSSMYAFPPLSCDPGALLNEYHAASLHSVRFAAHVPQSIILVCCWRPCQPDLTLTTRCIAAGVGPVRL